MVEDERHIARFLDYVLRKEGYEVEVEYDAERALKKAVSFRPHAILLDLVLPGMSGLEMLRALREDASTRDLIIIALSAQWFWRDEQALHDAGANAHCAKPIAPSTLIRKLHEFGIDPGPKTRRRD